MSKNYPLLNKSISKNYSSKSKENKNYPRTISSDFHSKKKINLEDLFGGMFFKNNKNHKKFNGNEAIKEALNIGKRLKTESTAKNLDNSYIKYADELVQNTQISARNNYIENISQKFKLSLHNDFKKTLLKSTDEGVLELEKKLEEIERTKQRYENALNENARLEQQLVDLNNDLRMISNKLFEKNQLINKEQVKNETFKLIQPIFEELIKEFPDEDPKELISSFRRNKEKYLSQIHELNKLNIRINDIENTRKNEGNKNTNFQENIKDKILQQKQLTDSMVNHFEKEYKIYKDEFEILQNYKKENIVLKQLLYNLYLWIKDYIHPKKYENFVKKIKYDPVRQKNDFNVEIFNHKEFISLVNENILSNVTNCYDGVLLRTTIVYGNYLARRHLKQKDKYRYDPVGTFREIKSSIDAKEFENYQLKGVIKNLNQKKINSHLKIKELEHQVQKAKIKFQGLLTKFEKYIKLTNKIKGTKTNSIHELIKDEKKIRSTSAYPSLANSFRVNTLTSRKRKIAFEEEDKSEKVKVKAEEQKEMSEKKKKLRKTVNGFYNVRRKFFLTNDGQKGVIKKKGMEIIKEEKDASKNNLDNSFNKKYFKTVNNKLNDSLDKIDSEDLNSIDKEVLLEINNRTVNNDKIKSIQRKKLIDLQISKNRDKLIKTNGFNGTENLLMNIKNIMNELFYTENPRPKLDKAKEDKNTLESNRFASIRENKKTYPRLEQFRGVEENKQSKNYQTLDKKGKRPLTSLPQISYGKDYNDISNKIMTEIDNIITKVNEIDLHDFSTDQKYKDKRKLNLFSQMNKEKIEKKNSIDSLLIDERNESFLEFEGSEEFEEEEENTNK